MSERKHVIIVGAGPVGCVSALILARAGISVTVLEAQSGLLEDMRASTFHPPTLDMLDALGVTPELIARGRITPVFQFRDREQGLIAEFDLSLIRDHTGHPYRLQCEQYKLTAVIAGMLDGYPGAQLIYDARVTALEQSGDVVTATFQTPGGEQRLAADYLIGCDGSRSIVRKSMEVGFPGFTFPEQFLVVSTTDDLTETVPDMADIAYISDPEEWCAVIRAPEMWRLLFPVEPGAEPEDTLSDDYLNSRIRSIAVSRRDHTITHRTLYDVNQRVAEQYRIGRVLLAGDAAHVNNPLGGMGMNGGIHDGINVAEKLVEVLTQGADPEVLDAYDRQRRPIAIEYVQQQSVRNKKTMEEKDPAIRRQRQDELRAVAGDREKSIEFLLRTSMINAVRRSQALT